MDQEKYLNDKLLWASHFLKENVGLKLSYNQNDVFKVLTKFGYVENITLITYQVRDIILIRLKNLVRALLQVNFTECML